MRYLLSVIILVLSNGVVLGSVQGDPIKHNLYKKKNVSKKSSHFQVSLMHERIGFLSACGAALIEKNYHCIPGLLNSSFKCTYWFNNSIGVVGGICLFGEADEIVSANTSIIGCVVGLKWSYNNKGQNGKGISYNGGFNVNMWLGGTIKKYTSDPPFHLEPSFRGKKGISFNVTYIEMVTPDGWTLGFRSAYCDISAVDFKGFLIRTFFCPIVFAGKTWRL